ncbi:MAG: dephospho-CoA kinase [Bacteroidales bacterium]|nr:dephospho-CoA kinase [Bacteroidales bacterium]
MRVGITGGIGSGKSIVGQVLVRMGHPLYDADSRAKWLIEHDGQLVEGITMLLGPWAYADGRYNRIRVAQLVFDQPHLLHQLNALVHPAVAADFERWASSQHGAGLVFMEAAILFESQFDKLVERTVAVLAPDRVRIERVMRRDGAIRQQVEVRMRAQMPPAEMAQRADLTVNNDGKSLIVPQIIDILQRLSE